MSEKIKKLIPKNPGKGNIYPINMNQQVEEIEFQPGHGLFFIPEHLGFRIGEYVEFFEWDTNNQTHLCIVTAGCPKTGRKISAYEKPNEQRRARRKGNACISFSLPDFNRWYLNLDIPKVVKHNNTQNHGLIFHGWLYAFAEYTGQQWSTRVRLGVVMNTTPIRVMCGKTNPTAHPPSQLGENINKIFK